MSLAAARERMRPDPMISAARAARLLDLYIAGHAPTAPRLTFSFDGADRFPPTLVQAGAREMLAADAIELARGLASAGADWAGGGYADYYFSVTPAESLASTLPVYDADGGFKSWKVGLTANASLSGDLRRGFSVFGLTNYSHLTNDFADSPIVKDRGSPSQWMFAAGLGYSW